MVRRVVAVCYISCHVRAKGANTRCVPIRNAEITGGVIVCTTLLAFCEVKVRRDLFSGSKSICSYTAMAAAEEFHEGSTGCCVAVILVE